MKELTWVHFVIVAVAFGPQGFNHSPLWVGFPFRSPALSLPLRHISVSLLLSDISRRISSITSFPSNLKLNSLLP